MPVNTAVIECLQEAVVSLSELNPKYNLNDCVGEAAKFVGRMDDLAYELRNDCGSPMFVSKDIEIIVRIIPKKPPVLELPDNYTERPAFRLGLVVECSDDAPLNLEGYIVQIPAYNTIPLLGMAGKYEGISIRNIMFAWPPMVVHEIVNHEDLLDLPQ